MTAVFPTLFLVKALLNNSYDFLLLCCILSSTACYFVQKLLSDVQGSWIKLESKNKSCEREKTKGRTMKRRSNVSSLQVRVEGCAEG